MGRNTKYGCTKNTCLTIKIGVEKGLVQVSLGMEYVRLNKANPIYRCIPHRILSSRTHGSIDTVYTGRTMHSNSTGGGGGGHAVVRDDTAAVDGGGGGGVEGSMGRKRRWRKRKSRVVAKSRVVVDDGSLGGKRQSDDSVTATATGRYA